MKNVIKITYEPSTNILSVDGVKGKSCQDITKELENALGEVVKVEKTKEYYEKEVNTNVSTRSG